MHNGDAHDAPQHDGHGEHGHGGRAPRGFRETFLIPIAIPVAAVIVIFAIVLSVSQILLAVPESVSTAVALCIALIILLACAYLATSPSIRRQTIYSFIAGPAIVLFSFGIVAGIYRQENPKHEGAQATAASGPPPDEVASDNQFSVTKYTIAAGQAVTINITNKGQAVHNFDIPDIKDASGNPVKTDAISAGETVPLAFTIDTPGTYNFRCDFHPTQMFGTITVTAPNPAAAGAAGGAGGITEVATDDKYSQTTITVNHGDKVNLTLQNNGQALHNFDVMGGAKDSSGNAIKTDLVPPGQSASLSFEIDTPGSYPFQCDVHPTEMKGTLIVK